MGYSDKESKHHRDSGFTTGPYFDSEDLAMDRATGKPLSPRERQERIKTNREIDAYLREGGTLPGWLEKSSKEKSDTEES